MKESTKVNIAGFPVHISRSDKVLMLGSFSGWQQNLGSTGICSMGDGFFYVGVNGKEDGRQVCDFKLYQHTASPQTPFIRP